MTVDEYVRVTVSITAKDRRRLRRVAADGDISVGVLVRAMIRYGLAHRSDAELVDLVREEKGTSYERSAAAGRAAMRVRYADDRKETRDDPPYRHDPAEGD